jgi:hypothetical protein
MLSEEMTNRSGPPASRGWIDRIVRAYWLICAIVAVVWMLLWVASVVIPSVGVGMIWNTYRGWLERLPLDLFAVGVLMSATWDWVHGRPPWAPFFPQRYPRKGRAGSRVKP